MVAEETVYQYTLNFSETMQHDSNSEDNTTQDMNTEAESDTHSTTATTTTTIAQPDVDDVKDLFAEEYGEYISVSR